MLQKLEDFYLAILRFVVIVGAGILLVAVALLAVRSFGVMGSPPEPVAAAPAVSAEEVKRSVLASTASASLADAGSPRPSGDASDPDYSEHLETAKAIKNYLDASFPGQFELTAEMLVELVSEQSGDYDSAALRSAHARGLAESIAPLLADDELIAFGREHGPGEALDRVLSAFKSEFDRQVEATNRANEAAHSAFLDQQAEAQRNLYLAVSGFGIFLLVVFLSIIIRIERNLRPRESDAAP